ncbi:MAG: hypothetical protein WCK01_01700 [Candidatus Uhrbacteria bacterium]
MLIRALKAFNRLPVNLTVKHIQTFGNQTNILKDQKLDSPEAWDELRRAHPQFSIAQDREEWLRACNIEVKKDGQDGGLIVRAKAIAQFLTEKGITRVFSVGVGGAGLEYQLKRLLPELKVIATEYAPENVEMLRRVFTECDDIHTFDILRGNWNEVSDTAMPTMLIMYRVDPHFTDQEWRTIFANMHTAGVEDILYIPCGFLTMRSLVQRKLRILRLRFRGQQFVFSGYLRTAKVFASFWTRLYSAQTRDFGGLTGYALHREDK